MGNNLDVYVLDSDGDPLAGVWVKIFVDGELPGGNVLFSGGYLDDEITDDEGHARFETTADYEDSRELTIYVRNQAFGPHEIGGRAYTVELTE